MARASTSIVAVVLLVAVTTIGAAAVGASVAVSPAEPPPRATLSLSAAADADAVTLTHNGGAPLDVAALTIRITVAGEPLAHQPPVPYFAARGFAGTPTGPFNVGYEGPWVAGQSATLALASTNRPLLDRGDAVRVRVATNRGVVARLSTRAR